VWLVVGDVAGHGLNAAVIMGRVKSALRAYTLVADNSAAVLEMTDRKVQQFEIGTLITVACASSKPPYDTWEICTAGHPPPVLATPGSDSRLVELPVGPPLGAVAGVPRSHAIVELPASGVLVLYTDGLVERHGEDIDAGLERLRASVTVAPPAVVCQTVTHTLIEPTSTTTDDIALLAIQRSPIADD
jgi:phosphoserine phosphatase RsbU/P